MGIDVAVECLLFVVYHTWASGVSLMVAGGLRSNGTSCFEREGRSQFCRGHTALSIRVLYQGPLRSD